MQNIIHRRDVCLRKSYGKTGNEHRELSTLRSSLLRRTGVFGFNNMGFFASSVSCLSRAYRGERSPDKPEQAGGKTKYLFR